ncbi:serine/threonine protein kinase [Gigaspora margarita]|uniref:Serine/threonine protein kinase n=1 Tax=Gigaspora margarita TaxID=4874 RepID=A0A8H4AZR6_GIGMA|nr:serine/threonine protein kinase [Gigaspora margarita]
MLSKKILDKVRYSSYWKRPYTRWTINTWDNFYFINYPNKVSSHRDLGKELKVLVEQLGPETKEGKNALALKRQLKCTTLCDLVRREEERPDIELLRRVHLLLGSLVKKDEKKNRDITSTKWKAIEKVKPKKKHKTIEKEEREEKLPEEDPVISIPTSVNHALKISLPEIVLNTIPNLVYLDLRDKSNSTTESTKQHFPDEITNWLEFEREVRTWQPEADKKYQKPTFRTHNVTCEKVIWTTTDVNISDALKPLDRHISFWMTVL